MVGTGDFNGTVKPESCGATRPREASSFGTRMARGASPTRALAPVNTSWQVAGTGDFNGAGADGILWRNASTGGVELWNSNGSGGFTYESLNPVNTNWQVAGTGNFVGNGEDGILWRNPSTGGVELWNPNGSGGFTYEALAPVNTNWQIAGTGDFTGNGEDGILWHNSSTGLLSSGTRTGRGASTMKPWPRSTPTGRSSGQMISPRTASPGFSGATAPTATRSYGIPTARAASLPRSGRVSTNWSVQKTFAEMKAREAEEPPREPPSSRSSLGVGRLVRPRYSSNRSLSPTDFKGAIEASGPCAARPWSRKRLTIG